MSFLVDLMCGGVVSYLRMCGHDTVYAGDEDLEADDEVLTRAARDDRTIVTRDVALAARADRSLLLSVRDTEGQLAELAAAGVDLTLPCEPTRCGRCNGRLDRVDRSEATPEYAPDPSERSIWRCRSCGQCFWKGSHWDRVAETLSRVRERA